MLGYLHEQLEVVSSFLGISAEDIEKTCPTGLALPDTTPTTRQIAMFKRTILTRPDSWIVRYERIIMAALDQLPFYGSDTTLGAWMEVTVHCSLTLADVTEFESPRLLAMQDTFRTAWVNVCSDLACGPA